MMLMVKKRYGTDSMRRAGQKLLVATRLCVADTGGLQWFQLKPPLKERAPLISNDWYRNEQKSP